jgi:Putative peptidoglycan binding domain
MALTSPRFIASRHLRNVAANQATLSKGARGRSVHLVQQALLDLNYALPRSTGNAAYSPDGIFGDETDARVREFQARSGLKDDGIVGWRTLQALTRRLPGYQHRVRLHFRSIALPRISFERSLLDAQVIFGQYGIKVEYGSGESLLLTPAQMRLFDRIDNDCEWTLSTGEYNELHSLGTRAPNDEILVYQVKALKAGDLGCGGHAVNRPAVTVAGHASRWDTAHEVGHVLLGSGFSPVHVNDRRNLMHPTAATYSTIPVLTDKQVKQMRRSVCCKGP